MTLKEKRDLVISKQEELNKLEENDQNKYQLIIDITSLMKEIYNNTGLFKDKIELINMYLYKAHYEERYLDDDNKVQKAFNTIRKAKRLVDELILHNHNIHERKIFISCYYDYINLGNKLENKKVNKNLFKLLYNCKLVYHNTQLIDDLKDILRTYLLIAGVYLNNKKRLLARIFYKKALDKMIVLYDEFNYEGMKEDIIYIINKIIKTYRNKNKKVVNKWIDLIEEYGGNYE